MIFKNLQHVALVFALPVFLLFKQAIAQDEADIGMVTGPANGTSYHIGRDIAVLARQANLDITVKPSAGSLENIARLESIENAGLAIVQSDVLGYLRASKDAAHQQQSKRLRMLLPLYKDEIHIFAKSDIATIQDLSNKRVIVGARNSGSDLTAKNILSEFGVEPAEIIYMSPQQGLEAIMQLQLADAMFYVAGAPDDLLAQLARLPERIMRHFHFLPLKDLPEDSYYFPVKLTKLHYPWMIEDIPTFAVTAMLVAYDFSREVNDYHRLRCRQFTELSTLIRDQFDELVLNGHSKWREVDLNSRVGDWPQDKCSVFLQE